MERKKEITAEQALSRLESLCSRSEQCEFDLERKMIGWRIPSSKRKEIIEKLKEDRFVDNARYAASYANDKSRFSSWGPYKIKMELGRRKISATDISVAIKRVPRVVWKEGLLKNARSKAAGLELNGEDSRNERLKLFRFLVARGFPAALVNKAVKYMCEVQKKEEGSLRQ